MYRLHLDATKLNNKIVLLYKEREILDKISGDVDSVGSIKELLKKNGLSIKDIDDFTYEQGPGSYTGLKISSSITNTFNWLLKKRDPKNLEMPEYGSEPNITKPKSPQSLE